MGGGARSLVKTVRMGHPARRSLFDRACWLGVLATILAAASQPQRHIPIPPRRCTKELSSAQHADRFYERAGNSRRKPRPTRAGHANAPPAPHTASPPQPPHLPLRRAACVPLPAVEIQKLPIEQFAKLQV